MKRSTPERVAFLDEHRRVAEASAAEQVAVCACSCEPYFRFIGLVNEKPIWGDVAFAFWKPVADERMIAVSSADCLVARIAILMGVCARPTSQSKTNFPEASTNRYHSIG